jgi:hypothetical protein
MIFSVVMRSFSGLLFSLGTILLSLSPKSVPAQENSDANFFSEQQTVALSNLGAHILADPMLRDLQPKRLHSFRG